jgi:hypothetical protein
MRHADFPGDVFRWTIGAAARLTVHDDAGGKPVFGKWKPYDARAAVAVPSHMREMESPAVHVPETPELALGVVGGPVTVDLTPSENGRSRHGTASGATPTSLRDKVTT